MADINFSNTKQFFYELFKSHNDFREIVVKLEDSLNEVNHIQTILNQLEPEILNLEIDIIHLSRASEISQKTRDSMTECFHNLTESYNQTVMIDAQLSAERYKNISRYTVLSKQIEVEEELQSIIEEQKADAIRHAAMENRHIGIMMTASPICLKIRPCPADPVPKDDTIKDFRNLMHILQKGKNELMFIEKEEARLDTLWQSKLERATSMRNEHIVNLIKLSYEHAKLREQQNGTCNTDRVQEGLNVVQLCTNRIRLQSALEFINNYPDENQLNTAPETPQTRSILMHNTAGKDKTSNKQVQFKSPPEFVEVFDYSDTDTQMESTNYLPEKPILQTVEYLPTIPAITAVTVANDDSGIKDFNNLNELHLMNMKLPHNSLDNLFQSMEVDNYEATNNNNNSAAEERPAEMSWPIAEQVDMDSQDADKLNFSVTACDDDFLLNLSSDGEKCPQDGNHSYQL